MEHTLEASAYELRRLSFAWGAIKMSINAFQRRPARKAGANAEQAATDDAGGLLDSLKKRSGDLMGRVAGSVKDAARSNLLKQAIAAHRRGNLAAAFYLAMEEYEAQPDEPEIAHFYWEVAVAYERPAEAVAAVVGLIKKNVLRAHEFSIKYWIELSGQVPDALIDPSTLARMIPHLADLIDEAGEVEDPELSEEEKQNPLVSQARKDRRAREIALRAAIRGVVDDRNRDLLTAGLAMHVAELVRELDPTSALAAARFALDCEDVHENKRDRLRILVAELDPDDPPRGAKQAATATRPSSPERTEVTPLPKADQRRAGDDGPSDSTDLETNPACNHPLYEKAPEQSPLSGDEVSALKRRLSSASRAERNTESADVDVTTSAPKSSQEPVVERAPEPAASTSAPIPIEMAAEAPVFMDFKRIAAQPTELSETELSIHLEGGRRSRINLDKVQAVAVAEIDGMADVPVVIVDLLMNSRGDDDTPLRVVRLRDDEFDPLALMPEESDSSAALQAFLSKLMEHTHAIPLPDPEAALGLVVPHFDSLDAYEQQVLQVRR
jgi:hypothetical protein